MGCYEQGWQVEIAGERFLDLKVRSVTLDHPETPIFCQFCVFENEMQEIIKTYTYAYSGEEI